MGIMKSIIGIVLVAVLGGLVLGIVLAAVQARPMAVELPSTDTSKPEAGVLDAGVQDGQSKKEQSKKAPRAQLEETVYNFGSMEQGTSLSHAFKVRNVGGSPLSIEVGATTCKCTVGGLSTREVGPDEEAEVTLEWIAKTSPGPFRHGATLITSDPLQSRVELHVEGTVVESTSVVPSEFYFGNVHAGETREEELTLMAFLQDEIEIRSCQFSDPEIAGQVEVKWEPCPPSDLPQAAARAGVRIKATLQAGRTLGPIHAWLAVETNLEHASKFDIPLVANVIGDMSIFGPGWVAKQGMLRLGQIPSEEGKQTRLIIAIRGVHASTTVLKIATVRPAELHATLGPHRKMGEQLVHVPLVVEIPAGTRAMLRRSERFGEAAEIVISTTHPQTSQLILQVEFAVHK
jgi:hypothetical protein